MKVTHLEVAEREINSAIRLLLKEGDMLAVHTIVSAAHGVTYAMCRRKEIPSFMKDVCKKYIKEEFQKRYIDSLNEAGNFLKHATHDTNESIDFHEINTHLLLYDACGMYFELTKKFSKEMHAYSTYMRIKYPQFLSKYDPRYEDTMKLVAEVKEKDITETKVKEYLYEAFIKD